MRITSAIKYVVATLLCCVCSTPLYADCGNFEFDSDELTRLSAMKDDREKLACLKIFRRVLLDQNTFSSLAATADNQMGSNGQQVSAQDTATRIELLNAVGNSIEQGESQLNSQEAFKDFGFGLGVGYSFGADGDRIQDADVVSDILRVKTDTTDQSRVVLEAHWFFVPWDNKDIGIGPFASINTGGSADGIGSFALGIMVGFRDRANASKSSWNIGLGYIVDSDVQVLGDGLTANQPLPDGESGVRFKKESQGGYLVMFSRGF